jgi:hypothetical protein
MIVRILGEGQFDLEGEALAALKVADAHLLEVVAQADEEAFRRSFRDVLDLVRGRGKPVPTQRLVESDLVLPSSDTSLDEARSMFTEHPA